MVMRPFRNIAITKQKPGFSFSRNVSTNTYTHQFFNPSYISPKDLIKVDEVGFNSNTSSNDANRSIFKYVTPALSVTKNYVIFNTSNSGNDEHVNSHGNRNNYLLQQEASAFKTLEESNDYDKILLRKLNHKGNKNGRLNISIDSVSQNHTVLNIRRANSNNIRKVAIPNKSLIASRNFSTDNLEKKLENLQIKDAEEGAKDAETTNEKQPVTGNHVKFQQLNDQANYRFESVDDALDTFLYTDPVKSQEVIIDSMMSLGKFNEVLPVFIRMRNNEIIPSIEIYNKVLKSIQLRETDETLEARLTHLLNTYSDMLSNNLKPNNTTYELIIDNLVKGSIKSYQLSNYKNGYEFFKIAFELFLINHKESTSLSNTFKNNSIYINLLTCLNYYKVKDVITPQNLFDILNKRIISQNQPEFYIQMIKFSTLFKDLHFIENLYNTEIKSVKSLPAKMSTYTNQDAIHQQLIESYNLCNNFKKSTLLLDTIVNNIPDKESSASQHLIAEYLSIFLRSQSLVDPVMAFKSLYKFNNLKWLPAVSVESLVVLSYSFLRLDELQMALKVWDFAVLRSDFDFQNKNLCSGKNSDEYSIYICNFHNQLVTAILNTGDKNLIMKSVREVLCKNSLILDDALLVNLIRYLNMLNVGNELVVKLTLNQGYKRIMRGSSIAAGSDRSLNNYLSLLVDFLPLEGLPAIFNSTFFKRVVEEYRLLNDNIYGILKMFDSVQKQPSALDESSDSDKNTRLKLKYYAKVLDYEFDDADNCYVQIPQEISNFKQHIQQFI
ncbi:hypothetical protein PMKS-001262 [Pichia membranifaciens]|uniref:Uncharacterized protein n=1 Tax=Pichia membranifaciens TaxID=4926 RepID=A0A1Q2YE47_9ASCO|nr:hypothetical protein PMKS-001262 [Pichia membranifaciens]